MPSASASAPEVLQYPLGAGSVVTRVLESGGAKIILSSCTASARERTVGASRCRPSPQLAITAMPSICRDTVLRPRELTFR